MELKKAAIINAVGKYSTVIIQLIVTAILSRILSPKDYGVVAVVTVFTTFFTTLSNMGFGTAIIQNKTLTQKDIDNIYSVTVYISLILSLIFSIMSFAIAWFYKKQLYIPVTMLLSISLFFNSLNMVPNGVLNRDKRFVTIAVRTVAVYSIAAVIAIILALLGLRYYALVLQTIFSALLTFVWNYFSVRPKFNFKVEIESIKKIANYSGYQFAFNFVNYFAANLDNLLTGKFFGHAELGYYNKAYNLTLYPINNLTGVISPVLHPILSDLQSNKTVLYQKYIKILKLLSLLGSYAEAICILAAHEIIYIVFGNQWGSSVVCFQMLSMCILFRMVNSSSGAIFQSLGDTKRLFQNGLLNTIISIIAILVGIFCFKDIRGLSICVGVAYILHYFTASAMLIRGGFSYTLASYYKELKGEVIIFVGMIAGVIGFMCSGILVIDNLWLSLLTKVVYVTIIYVLFLLITKEYKVLQILVKRN